MIRLKLFSILLLLSVTCAYGQVRRWELNNVYDSTLEERLKYYKGQPFTGYSVEYHWRHHYPVDSFRYHRLEERIHYKNGVEHGWKERWSKNGVLTYRLNYKNGSAHGVEQSWWSNGREHNITKYRKGQRVGKQEMWHENGQRRLVRHFKNDKPVGDLQAWHATGQPLFSEFTDAYGNYALTEWCENGQKRSELYIKSGDTIAHYISWTEGGGLLSHIGQFDVRCATKPWPQMLFYTDDFWIYSHAPICDRFYAGCETGTWLTLEEDCGIAFVDRTMENQYISQGIRPNPYCLNPTHPEHSGYIRKFIDFVPIEHKYHGVLTSWQKVDF